MNIGIAVAADDALFVPTIFDADRRSVQEISEASKELVRRARTGQLAPDDLAGGTFSVTNLGMFGVTRFTPIINPPQAAILAVGAVTPAPPLGEDRTAAQVTAVLTLVCDHRVVYGAVAAQFLARVCELLANPQGLP